MKTNLPGLLSIACSLGLIPAAVVFGEAAFFALSVLNFVLFHAVWLVQFLKRPRPELSKGFKAATLPLIFFAACGNFGWIYLARTGGLSFAV